MRNDGTEPRSTYAPVGRSAALSAVVEAPPPSAIAITRIYQAPTVTKVSATSGPATGDRAVTITGTNLSLAGVVEFGGVPASKYFINAAGTEVAALSPAREVAGTVDVTVRTPGGTSKITTKDHYKYLPVITSVFPSSGPATGINEWGAAWIAG